MYLLEPISVAFGDGDFGSVGWHAGSLVRHLKSPEIRIVEGLVYREWHSPAGGRASASRKWAAKPARQFSHRLELRLASLDLFSAGLHCALRARCSAFASHSRSQFFANNCSCSGSGTHPASSRNGHGFSAHFRRGATIYAIPGLFVLVPDFPAGSQRMKLILWGKRVPIKKGIPSKT